MWPKCGRKKSTTTKKERKNDGRSNGHNMQCILIFLSTFQEQFHQFPGCCCSASATAFFYYSLNCWISVSLCACVCPSLSLLAIFLLRFFRNSVGNFNDELCVRCNQEIGTPPDDKTRIGGKSRYERKLN